MRPCASRWCSCGKRLRAKGLRMRVRCRALDRGAEHDRFSNLSLAARRGGAQARRGSRRAVPSVRDGRASLRCSWGVEIYLRLARAPRRDAWRRTGAPGELAWISTARPARVRAGVQAAAQAGRRAGASVRLAENERSFLPWRETLRARVARMKSPVGTLASPFPYFGGKSRACAAVWNAFGEVDNYIEPFAGSVAMLLGAPDGDRIETINDLDAFISNFWRAIAHDPDAVADFADWPTNEVDLFARHSWLVRQRDGLLDRLHGDPEWFDAKIAGWWCWGACNWIGAGWCSGTGPWIHDGEKIVDSRNLPQLSAGPGIKRQLPHLGNAGQGINRQLPHLGTGGRGNFIHYWFSILSDRLRDVRITCGDWSRVLTDSVTVRKGTTAIFLDPPYARGEMDYAVGGVGGEVAADVRCWCADHGDDERLRIVLCGHAGEHDALLARGWHTRTWTARAGYARTVKALKNSASETLWCSPACVPDRAAIDLFTESA